MNERGYALAMTILVAMVLAAVTVGLLSEMNRNKTVSEKVKDYVVDNATSQSAIHKTISELGVPGSTLSTYFRTFPNDGAGAFRSDNYTLNGKTVCVRTTRTTANWPNWEFSIDVAPGACS